MHRLILFALISIAIFEGRGDALLPIALATMAAAVAARRLPRSDRPALRVVPLLRFLPYFIGQSVRGGMDVALRALRGRRAVAPGFIVYRTGIRSPGVRVFFVNAVSLLPGTFSAELRGERVLVHTLDEGLPVHDRLLDLERRIRAVFGEDGP